jgi:hypothetical protein
VNVLLRLPYGVLSCVVWIAFAQAAWAQEEAARARQILSDPEQSGKEARAALLTLGDAAVEPVEEALGREQHASPPRQVFLVGILDSLKSPNSDRALGHLLADRRPLVRASAPSALGRNHAICAVPHLVRLLGDRAEYGQEVSTDPHQEKALTVATAASKALQTITGLHRKTDGGDAKGFERWWDRRKSRQDCKRWN